jgi:hypothetical protein|tara:strand:- start:6853 stop:7089 length:237 start_codon:yes stop_codon:yes gene_type:complete
MSTARVKKVAAPVGVRKNFGRFAAKVKKPCVIYIRNIEEKDRDIVRKALQDERLTLSEFFTELIRDYAKSKKTTRKTK